MNAIEARELAIRNNSAEHTKHFGNVIEAITKAAHKGELKVYYYQYLPKSVQDQLEMKGYKITRTPDGRNGEDITISWE